MNNSVLVLSLSLAVLAPFSPMLLESLFISLSRVISGVEIWFSVPFAIISLSYACWIPLSFQWLMQFQELYDEGRRNGDLTKIQELKKDYKKCKYFSLVSGLVSAGLVSVSDDKDFVKMSSFLTLTSGAVGIANEAIKDFILEPQEKKIQEDLIKDKLESLERGLREEINQVREVKIEVSKIQ
jgi:hypothetical protein